MGLENNVFQCIMLLNVKLGVTARELKTYRVGNVRKNIQKKRCCQGKYIGWDLISTRNGLKQLKQI